MGHDQRRKGYGTDATRLTLNYASTAHGLHRVEAEIFEYNEPSIRLARRVGFTEFGRARQGHWAGGRNWDVLLFDMLREEFESPVLAGKFAFFEDRSEG